MIKKLSSKNADAIREVINEAARAYKGNIPADCYHQPYMSLEELRREMRSIVFFGWYEGGKLTAIMGFQPVRDVTLLRHAYVLPGYQQKGIGARLTEHLKGLTKTRCLMVGTWTGATWAIRFYEKQGFKLVPDKDRLLTEYWDIPQRQIETSVALSIEVNGA